MQKQLPNLLIVDDTAENLLFLEVIIKKLEVNLIKASSGQQALEKTKGLDLVLAILDVSMPQMSGYELAERINNERVGNKVPVIFLTAIAFSALEVNNGYRSGAVDYIFKPVDRQILLSKIGVFIELFHQKQTIVHNSILLNEYNDKLILAHTALKESEEKYKSYIENAPDGVLITDETGKYLEVNKAACRLTGYSKIELLNKSMSDMLFNKSVEDIEAFFGHLKKHGSISIDSTLKHKKGTKRWLEIDAVQLSKKRFLGFVKDVTENKQAAEALAESEDRFRSFFELNADLMAIATPDGYFRDLNSSWSRIFGYSNEELMSKPFFEFVHPDDILMTKNIFEKKVSRGDTVLSFENRYLRKDGTVVWLEWTAEPQLEKSSIYAIARDITERKKNETELKSSIEQLHQLSRHIDKVRENERVAISRELHDDLGQALTAVKIDLGLIKQKVADIEVISRINKVSSLVSDTIKTVQRLTAQLRPQILEDLGLDAAIEWHAKEYTERFGIAIVLDMDEGISLSPDASLTIFRIMQESLTNVARHSQATHVVLQLNTNNDSVNLRISDNGIGISEDEISSRKSFGLIGMKERASSLGGKLDVYNQIGAGTIVDLVIPL